MANIVSLSNEHLRNNVIWTKKDTQMKAALNLELLGGKKHSSTKRNWNIFNVLNDHNSVDCEKKTSISTVKSTMFLFLDHTAQVCIVSSKIPSPIPSLKYVHRGKENYIRQDIKK